MSAATKRLLKELSSQYADPNPALDRLEPISEDDIFTWKAVLNGVHDSPYEGGKWEITITIPPTYPMRPPEMKFDTKICHPNIHFDTGEVCLDVLKSQWTPAWTISSACTAVQVMLSDPEPDSPLNIDAANLARSGDKMAYEDLIRYYTAIYAKN